jgi:hypothetical protein
VIALPGTRYDNLHRRPYTTADLKGHAISPGSSPRHITDRLMFQIQSSKIPLTFLISHPSLTSPRTLNHLSLTLCGIALIIAVNPSTVTFIMSADIRQGEQTSSYLDDVPDTIGDETIRLRRHSGLGDTPGFHLQSTLRTASLSSSSNVLHGLPGVLLASCPPALTE